MLLIYDKYFYVYGLKGRILHRWDNCNGKITNNSNKLF